MYPRLVASITALAAVTMLSACGSTDDSATTTTVVTVTRTAAAPSETVDAPAATETVTSTEAPETVDPTTAETQTVGADRSAYVGHYQRHESLMDLEANQTGTLLEGASAADGENWAISWQPAAQGITITYEQLLKKSGKGLEAGLAPGRTFSARFTTGETGKQILSTSAIPPAIIAVGWCRSGPDGGSPECGA